MAEPRAIGPMEGRCLCGGVTVRVTRAADARPSACHCDICRTWSGGLFLCFWAEAADVEVAGEVRTYPSTPFADRAFCPRCGTHLWVRDHGEGDGAGKAGYDLMPGLFPALAGHPLRSEVYFDRAPAHAALAGDHPRRTAAEYEADHPYLKGDAP